MLTKLDTLGLFNIKVFWNKDYAVKISVHDITNKILSRDSNYIVDVVMWPKFGNSRILRGKLSEPQFYKDLTKKKIFFEGCFWFRFNNVGLAKGTTLTFYTSVGKGIKPKVWKFWGLIPTFV